jgi:hypothetical protein
MARLDRALLFKGGSRDHAAPSTRYSGNLAQAYRKVFDESNGSVGESMRAGDLTT